MKRLSFVNLITCLLIILFLYTGLYKVIHLSQFAFTLSNSPLIGHFNKALSILVPTTELIITLGLLMSLLKDSSVLRKWSLLCSAILMMLFTLYVGYMLSTSSRLPCSCGGVIREMNWHQHLYFNMLFFLLPIIALFLNSKNITPTTSLLLKKRNVYDT